MHSEFAMRLQTFFFIFFLIISMTNLMGEIKIIGHRGLSAEAPENTLASYKKALERGVDVIECDVHMTKDGEIVASHDPRVPFDEQQCTHTMISQMPLAQIRTYNVGAWFAENFFEEKIPLLEEILSLPLQGKAVMIEMKSEHTDPKAFAQAIARVITKHKEVSVFLATFEGELMDQLQSLNLGVPLIALCSSYHQLTQNFPSIPEYVGIEFYNCSKSVIDKLHEQKKKVWCWTVDSPKVAKRLAQSGVDGIITNDPQIIKDAIQEVR